MKYTTQFKKIDEVRDIKEASKLKREEVVREKLAKALSCKHRKHGGFYVINCTHPDRPKKNGHYRDCLDVSCPLFN